MFPWHIVALAELLGRHLFHVELLSGCENSYTLTKTLDVCGEVCFVSVKPDHTLSELRVVWVAGGGHPGVTVCIWT